MPELKIESIKISKNVENFRNGSWAIPEFQREYVWGKQKSKAARLIDSLYRNFPISAIFLWETNEKVRTRDQHSTQRRAIWVVDGQQRITTLFKVMEEESDVRVVFNPGGKDEKTGFDGQFQIENPVTKKSKDWVHVNEILGDSDDSRAILDGEKSKTCRDRLEHLRGILNYEVPVITMVGHSFQEATNNFKRINMEGTRLKAFDACSAAIAATHKNFVATQFAPFVHRIHEKGFNGINQMHLFKICEFNANNKNLYDIETSELKAAWAKTEKATENVMKFLDEQFGVKKMDILRSGALLVVPIALFSTLSGNDLDKEGLAGWLALASLHHHYSGATESTLTTDLKACGHQNPIRSLLANIKAQKRSLGLLADPENFGGQLNDKGALFAAYVACRHRGCLGLFTGEKLRAYYDVDQHHLFPRSRFVADTNEHGNSRRNSSDNIANIAFIKADANRKLGDEPPSVYLEGRKEDRLISQCIPLDKRLWTLDKAEAFWEARRELLAEAFNEFVQQKLSDYRLL